ncbi:hypothetical protein DL771_001822 [Monosporascus sp. 5C6A]|nr:hypothetical protein DL771_001822 [Monosporascus sp. 5C6A]
MHSPVYIRIADEDIPLAHPLFPSAGPQDGAQWRPEQHYDDVAERRVERPEAHPAGVGREEAAVPDLLVQAGH